MEWITIILILTLFSLLLWFSTRRPKNFPPGEARVPIIGKLIKGTIPDMEIFKGHKVTGSFVGNFPLVEIHDFELAKDLMSREEWCGRGTNLITRYLRSDNGINKGIITSSGQLWADQRKFAIRHLKEFGFGKVSMQEAIQDEVEDLVIRLSKTVNKDFKMETLFGVPVLNILWTIVAGRRFQPEDPKVQRMLTLLNRLFKSKLALEYIFPWWGLFCYFIPGLNTRRTIISELRSMFRESIIEHRASLDTNHPR